MPLPEVIVRRGDRGAAPLPADDVSTRFEVVVTARGPVGRPIECRSFAQVRQAFGDHTTTSTLRAVESYFAEGGTRAVLTRVVGPARATATATLRDSTDTVLTVTANDPGAFYNGVAITAATADSGRQKLTVAVNGTLLVSGTVASAAEAAELINRSGYVTAVVTTSRWPVRAETTSLAGGADDLGNVRDPEVLAGLATFDEDLGAGSVCASAWDTDGVIAGLADHAAANNRFARVDLGKDRTINDLRATAETARRLANARYVQLLAGWLNVSVAGVTVAVPPSGVHTGREALTDRENGAGPGQPCAWTFGEYRTPIGLARTFSRSDRELLNDLGVTVVTQNSQGAIYAEDAITVVDGTRYPQYAEVSAMRVTMAIHAQAKQALRQRVMQTIDGQGHLAALTTGDLVAICAAWYARDALYGADAGEAYSASVVAETEAGHKPRLVGYLALRPSPSAHTVELTITQVAPSDTI